jgi:hypothetical protein
MGFDTFYAIRIAHCLASAHALEHEDAPGMAEVAFHPRQSRFWVRAYLLTWGLLATGALSYLGTLVWPPELLSAAPAPAAIPQRPQLAEADQALRTASKALADVGSVRRAVGDVQKSVDQLQASIQQQQAQEKAVEARVAALEDRVSSVAAAVVAVQQPPPSPSTSKKAEKLEKSRPKAVAEKADKKDGPPRQPTRIISAAPAPKSESPAPTIETGSIAAAPAPIVFGDPVVTRAQESYAVQLVAAPSLDALRLNWTMLVDRHGPTLSELQPRYLSPQAAGGQYRLLAGPFKSAKEAARVCGELLARQVHCATTEYTGQPL